MVRKRSRCTRGRPKRGRPETPAPKAGWLIAELAELTRTPVRTIRYYVGSVRRTSMVPERSRKKTTVAIIRRCLRRREEPTYHVAVAIGGGKSVRVDIEAS